MLINPRKTGFPSKPDQVVGVVRIFRLNGLWNPRNRAIRYAHSLRLRTSTLMTGRSETGSELRHTESMKTKKEPTLIS